MAIDIGEPMGPLATPGSVLFVGNGPALAQDNAGFYFDESNNTPKSRNQATSATESFAISTGDITSTSSASSGALTIETGSGGTNVGSGTAGNSGSLTLSTGSGGGSGTAAAGKSGDLLLKTGTGGTSTAADQAGSAGSIIIHPGSSGGGLGGEGGSTIVRASNSGDILKVQNSAGTTTHLAVAAQI